MSSLSKAEIDELLELGTLSGMLTPETVLKRAQNPKSALHKRFTWDDAEAARLRRLDEAQSLIMRVRVRIQPRADMPPIVVRAFVSLDEDRAAGGGYRRIETVLGDRDMRAQALRTALGELQALQKRYGYLEELAAVFTEVQQLTARPQPNRKAKSAPKAGKRKAA